MGTDFEKLVKRIVVPLVINPEDVLVKACRRRFSNSYSIASK